MSSTRRSLPRRAKKGKGKGFYTETTEREDEEEARFNNSAAEVEIIYGKSLERKIGIYVVELVEDGEDGEETKLIKVGHTGKSVYERLKSFHRETGEKYGYIIHEVKYCENINYERGLHKKLRRECNQRRAYCYDVYPIKKRMGGETEETYIVYVF